MAAKRLLHIDSSILGPSSVSRKLTTSVVDKLRRATPALEVVHRDLAATALPHLSGAVFAATASGQAPQDAALQADLALGNELLEEFLAADIVVLGVGFYNFGVPSQLKAWVDRILVAGQTFRYGPDGVEGLAGGKRVIVALSRGNFYGADAPAAAAEHLEGWLRTVFGFVGVTDLEFVIAEGVQVGPEHRERALAGALAAAERLAA